MTVLNPAHPGGSPSSLGSGLEGGSELSRLAKAAGSLTLAQSWGVRPAFLSHVLRSSFGFEWPGWRVATSPPGLSLCAVAHEAASCGRLARGHTASSRSPRGLLSGLRLLPCLRFICCVCAVADA